MQNVNFRATNLVTHNSRVDEYAFEAELCVCFEREAGLVSDRNVVAIACASGHFGKQLL